MDEMIIVLFICIVLPLSLGLVFMKGHAKEMTLFLEIGMFICLLAAFVNGYAEGALGIPRVQMTFTITPLTEEVLKAIPIMFYVFLFKPGKNRIINNSLMVGIGFAILENAYIMMSDLSSISIPWALLRGLGAGMMHGICTLIVGYGLTYVYLRRKLAIAGTYALLICAVVYHACYNLLIQSDYRFFGILIPMATVIPAVLILYLGKKKKDSLAKGND